ncbi:MAG: methyltransferase domain-containing protein [Planctomycetota bacterium]|jgi:SAM-dependent methyltransferase
MTARRFDPNDLYGGSRFMAPLSEASLVEAGRAAGLRAGATLFEVGCGNGAAAVFLAEEFHLYARGLEAADGLLALARGHARRSAARARLRFFAADGLPPNAARGPVDVVCVLRGVWSPVAAALVRPGGRLLTGRYRLRGESRPSEIGEFFPVAWDAPEGEVVWRREATPLEWERFLAPQERALRVYRRHLRAGDPLSPVALAADRRIAAFRAHSAHIAYELAVTRLP